MKNIKCPKCGVEGFAENNQTVLCMNCGCAFNTSDNSIFGEMILSKNNNTTNKPHKIEIIDG